MILAHAWIKVSMDPTTETDQKLVTFRQQIRITYGHFVTTTNKKHLNTHIYSILPEDCSTKSLESQCHNCLLPIVSEFAGIIQMNPPPIQVSI